MKTTQKCSAFQEFVEYEIVSSRKITHWISSRILRSISKHNGALEEND